MSLRRKLKKAANEAAKVGREVAKEAVKVGKKPPRPVKRWHLQEWLDLKQE